jgi:hypothetical protein
MKYVITTTLMIFGFLLSPLFVHAQSIPTSFADASVDVQPEYPEPFEKVTLKLVSYSIPLDVRNVVWYVNGKEYKKGIGMTSITVTMGAANTETTVTVTVDASALEKINKTVSLRPNTVDLLWEAIDSYVPPFYRGKALMPPEGAVRVTTIPQGSNTLTSMAFTWLRNDRVSQSESGFGRNSLTLRNSLIDQSSDVGVRVVSPDGTYRAEGRVLIPRTAPFIRYSIYQGTTLVARAAEGTIAAPRGQFSVKAEPFYMSSRAGLNGLSFSWKLGEETIPLTRMEKYNELNLSSNGITQLVPVTTNITHQRNTSQEANGVINVRFEK